MSLRLKKREPVSAGLRRILRERLASAVDELGHFASAPDQSVHNARKRLKEARAVLRLARPALPEAIYAYEKTVYRDAARPLSQLRDTRILLDSLERIAPSCGARVDAGGARRDLEARRVHLQQQLLAGGLEPIRAALDAGRARLDDWPMSEGEWKTIRAALWKTYRSGRRGLRAAAAEPTDETLHEWRKRSKVLWYQLEVLEGLWPGLLGPTAEQVHRLTDLLGDDHDLAVLGSLLRADGAVDLPAESRASLLERIGSQRRDLQREALRLGRRVYAESTRRFVCRLGKYWRVWRDAPARRSIDPPVPAA